MPNRQTTYDNVTHFDRFYKFYENLEKQERRGPRVGIIAALLSVPVIAIMLNWLMQHPH